MPKSRDELKGAVDDCFCSTGPLGSGKAKDRSLKEISPTESSVKSLVVFPELRKDYATLQAINAQIVGGKLHGLGLDTKHPLVDVKAQSKNYLIAVLHKAFTAHLPITLCPDDIWLTILQGLAIHVNANADSLKASILKDPNKKDKQELLVRDDSLRVNDINNDWSHVFGSFTSQIEEHTVKGTTDVLSMGFSTSTPTTTLAGQCVVFKVMSSFFSYRTLTMCGIPEIFLRGTVSDWEMLRKKVELLRQYDLGWWIEHLVPICDEFVLLAKHLHEEVELSKSSLAFWSSIYHYNNMSGGPKVTGWIIALFPYVTGPDVDFKRNPLIDWTTVHGFGGMSPGSFPPGYTAAPMQWTYHGREIATQMNAGFFGSAQNPKTFALEPVIGWCVSEGEITLGNA